jgi:hypothetical protein
MTGKYQVLVAPEGTWRQGVMIPSRGRAPDISSVHAAEDGSHLHETPMALSSGRDQAGFGFSALL